MNLADRSKSALVLILGCAAISLLTPSCGDSDSTTPGGGGAGAGGKAGSGAGGKAGAASGGANTGGKAGAGTAGSIIGEAGMAGAEPVAGAPGGGAGGATAGAGGATAGAGGKASGGAGGATAGAGGATAGAGGATAGAGGAPTAGAGGAPTAGAGGAPTAGAGGAPTAGAGGAPTAGAGGATAGSGGDTAGSGGSGGSGVCTTSFAPGNLLYSFDAAGSEANWGAGPAYQVVDTLLNNSPVERSTTEGHTCPGALKATFTFSAYSSVNTANPPVSAAESAELQINFGPAAMWAPAQTKLHGWAKLVPSATGVDYLNSWALHSSSTGYSVYRDLYVGPVPADGAWHEFVVNLTSPFDVNNVSQLGIRIDLKGTAPVGQPAVPPVTTIFLDDLWTE